MLFSGTQARKNEKSIYSEKLGIFSEIIPPSA